ncbi:MAG: efflux RND transporter periplasmic adaptor subunit [Candidatus Riflebacteria bacterium]|nr:efflux RND transporter periplasmic adaptor subunit [Candidatus Riflebacteria bacterium]
MKRLFFYLCCAAIVAAIVYSTLQVIKPPEKAKGKRNAENRIAVEVSPIETGEISDEGNFNGTILPKSKFVVAPKISGRLKKLHCEAGQVITKGTVVAEIEDDELVQAQIQSEAELAISKASLSESEAQLDISKRELERVQAMRQQKVSSQADVETANAHYKTMQARYQVNIAQVNQKEAVVKAAKIRLSYSKIEAIWSSGSDKRIVGERFQDEGAMLSANTPIISVIDIDPIIVAIDVVERDYFRLKIGQKANVSVKSLETNVFSGTVARISPFLDSSTRQARVEIEVANPDYLLKPGMFVAVHLGYKTRSNVIRIPMSSVARRNERQGIFLADLEKGMAKFVPVELGILQEDMVEIASPAISGKVVTLGHHLLQDNSLIYAEGMKLNGDEKNGGKPDETKSEKEIEKETDQAKSKSRKAG